MSKQSNHYQEHNPPVFGCEKCIEAHMKCEHGPMTLCVICDDDLELDY